MTSAPRIFSVSHAGGSSAAFGGLRAALRPDFDVVPVDLPGHGRRVGEPLPGSVAECAEDLYRRLRPTVTRRDVLLGHSLGSWIVYEIAARLQDAGLDLPAFLVCSGNVPPPATPSPDSIANLPERDFLATVAELGNLPGRVFDAPELAALFVPILRTDYRMVESYHRVPEPVDCDILVLRGRQDPLTAGSPADWAACTRGRRYVHEFEGGHFFLYEHPQPVSDSIRRHYAIHAMPEECGGRHGALLRDGDLERGLPEDVAEVRGQGRHRV